MKTKSIENYEGYLKPWVKWLGERRQGHGIGVTSHVLKMYLDERFKNGSYLTYMRVGSQIKLFANRYLHSPIELIKSVSHKRNNEHV